MSFLVTEAERKHARRRARFQQHREASCHQVFFPPLQGKAPKETHAILRETPGEHAPSYGTVKNWVALFKSGDFPPVMGLVLDDTKHEILPCLDACKSHRVLKDLSTVMGSMCVSWQSAQSDEWSSYILYIHLCSKNDRTEVNVLRLIMDNDPTRYQHMLKQ